MQQPTVQGAQLPLSSAEPSHSTGFVNIEDKQVTRLPKHTALAVPAPYYNKKTNH